MVRKREEEVSDIFTVCVRCIALSRIVHGDSHWRLAKAHLQLARTYLELKGACADLPQTRPGLPLPLLPLLLLVVWEAKRKKKKC